MSAPALELVYRIRGELEELDQTILRVLRAWEGVEGEGADRGIFLDSVALNLHGFYAGLERLFELIEKHVTGRLPAGKNWHKELLRTMVDDVAPVRPAVLSSASATRLDPLTSSNSKT